MEVEVASQKNLKTATESKGRNRRYLKTGYAKVPQATLHVHVHVHVRSSPILTSIFTTSSLPFHLQLVVNERADEEYLRTLIFPQDRVFSCWGLRHGCSSQGCRRPLALSLQVSPTEPRCLPERNLAMARIRNGRQLLADDKCSASRRSVKRLKCKSMFQKPSAILTLRVHRADTSHTTGPGMLKDETSQKTMLKILRFHLNPLDDAYLLYYAVQLSTFNGSG